MKKTLRLSLLAPLVLLGATGAVLAQGQAAAPEASKAADPNAPKLVLKDEKVDVGVVPKGELIKRDFIVRNAGKSDLHITDVKPSCGCTVPEFDKVIKPGAEGKITLTVDTKSFQGVISKTALVMSDDPSTPQTTLFLQANVKPYVETLPYGFFRIQALTGEPSTAELILISDEPDFKPSGATVQQSYLKASLTPVAEKDRIPNKGPNQWKATLTCDANAPEGLLGGYVKVQTGTKKQPEMDLAISGYVKPTITVTPLSVNFGNFDPKAEPVKRSITLVNNNMKNDGFSVMKAESSVPGITAEVKPAENDKTRFQVILTVDQKIKKGVFDGELVIKTNDSNKGEVKVPLKGVIL